VVLQELTSLVLVVLVQEDSVLVAEETLLVSVVLVLVAAGAVVSLSVGEPIISTLEVQHKQNNYSFRQNLTGQLGERIEILRRGRRARAPKLHVRNGDCKYDRKFNFEYG